jgi:carbamoyl-phosphate synthase large subunit
MLDLPVQKPDKTLFDIDHVGVKASQFSFSRLQKADPVLGVDMVSTGEVGCIGDGYYEAILTAMLSVGYSVPVKGVLFSGGPARSKMELLNSARMLAEMGLEIYATGGTRDFFLQYGVRSGLLFWPDDIRQPNVLDYLREKKIDLVINIPKDLSKGELDNDYRIRRSAVDFNIPLITNARLASAFIYAVCKVLPGDIAIKSWQEY